MSQSLSQLYVHIVFHVNLTTCLTIPEKLWTSMHGYLATICQNLDSPSIIVGGIHDHIHILCRLSKNIAISKLIEELKPSSSKWLKTHAAEYGEILNDFSWQKGYAAFSVSSSQVEVVKNYIANQQEHHKKMDIKKELLLFLKKNNINYDEKYLWN